MKLMPASRALATMRDDVASSVGPPNIMVPRQIGEIFRPLRPRWRYCIGWLLNPGPSFRGDAQHRTRNLEIPGLVLTHHPGMTACFSTLALQYLEHAARHRDTAFVDRHLGGDENQAAGRA